MPEQKFRLYTLTYHKPTNNLFLIEKTDYTTMGWVYSGCTIYLQHTPHPDIPVLPYTDRKMHDVPELELKSLEELLEIELPTNILPVKVRLPKK